MREVPVQRSDSDPDEVGDLLRGRVHARGAEDGLRRREQGADVALRVGTQPTPCSPLRHSFNLLSGMTFHIVSGRAFRLSPGYDIK